MAFIRGALAALILLCSLSAAVFAEQVVNINTATAAEIAAAIDGVGPSKAEAIITYREENGPFASVDDLLEVKGIGEKILHNNWEKLAVE